MPNIRCEPLGGTEGLLETLWGGYADDGMCLIVSANARRQ